MSVSPPEALVGFLLVFFLPGYALARATFPEWRVRGERALEVAVELGTLAFVLSVVLTVLVGYALLESPGGFQASWSDPLLEGVLATVAVGAFGVGLGRGAYRREPPAARAPEPAPGSDGGWELLRQLEQTERERRRVTHALRRATAGSPEAAELESRRRALEVKSDRLRRDREAEYAG